MHVALRVAFLTHPLAQQPGMNNPRGRRCNRLDWSYGREGYPRYHCRIFGLFGEWLCASESSHDRGAAIFF